MWPRPDIPLLALCVAIFAAGPAGRAELRPGDPLPALAEFALAADTLPELRDRVVVLDFWASWCPPCRAAFAALAALHRDYAARGLVILAVGVDAEAPAYAAFLRRMAPPFATAHDRERRLAAAVGVPAMPSTFVFGRDGRLRSVHRGFHGRGTAEALAREIETLLQERE